MKHLFLILFLFGCAGDAHDLFPPTADAGTEQFGTAEQGLQSKFSPSFTYGVSAAPSSKKCTVAFGAGVNQTCLLPGKGQVKFKLTGADPLEGVSNLQSWRYLSKRVINFDFKNYVTPSLPWAQPVEEDTANTWLEVKLGTCPGNWDSNEITHFACLQWDLGSSPTVTESFVGVYKRFTGKVKVLIDLPKIETRVTNRECTVGPRCTASEARHELLEHAINAIMPAAMYQSGIYLADMISTGTNISWSSPNVYTTDKAFEHGGYTQAEGCRAGSWSDAPGLSTYIQASGSCND